MLARPDARTAPVVFHFRSMLSCNLGEVLERLRFCRHPTTKSGISTAAARTERKLTGWTAIPPTTNQREQDLIADFPTGDPSVVSARFDWRGRAVAALAADRRRKLSCCVRSENRLAAQSPLSLCQQVSSRGLGCRQRTADQATNDPKLPALDSLDSGTVCGD